MSNTGSSSTVEVGASDDEAQFVKNVERAFGIIGKLDPTKVICTMGIAVTPEGVRAFVLGSDIHISKMLSTMSNVIRDGMEKANNVPDHSNEAKH